MTQSVPTIGRFAPSPSGRMHLGNIFTALLAWLAARAAGGSIILRIEDLDSLRCRREYAELLKEDLLWLGLDWDTEACPQRDRGAAYAGVCARLEEMGLVYPCWCTRGDLHAASAPHASDGHPIYPGTCRGLSAEEIAQKKGAPSLRLLVPDEIIRFSDHIQGDYEENLATECGDFVIRKADGTFAYQLAVVVDDIAAGVTQVLRGCDLLSSTPRQLYLYRLLGAKAPEYAHVPLLLGPDGRRLSKRDLDLDVSILQKTHSAQQLIGYLAWLAGLLDRPEPAKSTELIPLFRWATLKKEDITVDLDKLASLAK